MTDLKDILYVEDDPDIQSVVQLALECIGNYNVRLCDSGADALATLTRSPPQLILLDVMMPGMDGISTYHAIHDFAPTAHIPIIFVTARVQKQEVEAYLNLGAIGVIHKPFDAIALAGIVRGFWDKFEERRVA